MKGIIFVSIFLGCSLLTGCGQKYYKNINSGRNFNQDASYCQSVAIGSVPNQIMQNNVQPYTPASGTMRDQYGNVYRYQGNYNFMAAAQNSMAMSQNSFNKLSANINTQVARDAIYNQYAYMPKVLLICDSQKSTECLMQIQGINKHIRVERLR